MHYVETTNRFKKTNAGWLEFGAQIGDLVNTWSGRSDIVAFASDEAVFGSGWALFDHANAEIEINLAKCFGDEADPAYVGDFTKRETHFEHPHIAGVLLHEAFHAKHSMPDKSVLMTLEGNTDMHRVLYETFEEIRIERKAIDAFPDNRSFLRASTVKFLLADAEAIEATASQGHVAMARLMTLLLGRATLGIVDSTDVKAVHSAAVSVYGKSLLMQFERIWKRVARLSDNGVHDRKELADQWIALLEENGHDPDEQTDNMPEELKELLKQLAAAAQAGEGEGDGEGGGEGESSGGAFQEMLDEIMQEARAEGTKQLTNELDEERTAERQERESMKQDNKKQASRVFGRAREKDATTGARTSSRLTNRRAPSDRERGAASILSKELDKARYRERTVSIRRSALPQGRLNMRGAMDGAQQKARGLPSTSEPWKYKRRFVTEDPNLTVGVMCDISGSMSRVMESTGVTAWVLSEATRHAEGTAAVTYFGQDVFPGLRPGERLREVEIYSASDSWEAFDTAFRALDGSLNLIGGSGARIVFIISDMYHRPAESKAAERWLQQAKADGIAVVIIAPDESMVQHAKSVVGDLADVLKVDTTDPTAMALVVGRAAIKELAKVAPQG